MKSISVKIDGLTFKEIEKIIALINIPRDKYINDAIIHYNKFRKKEILKNQLRSESELVKVESMIVLKEFENLEYAD